MSEPIDVALIALLVGFILLAIFLAATEASLLRMSRTRARTLAANGKARERRLLDLIERLPEVLNLILLLALLSQIGAATITGVLARRWFGNAGVTVASVGLTVVLFIYGEAIPKTFAVQHSERTALFVARPIGVLERLLRPLVRVLVWVADLQLPGKGIATSATVTEEELRLLAVEAADEGQITAEDKDLIDRAFRFGDRRVDDIMVPRSDIVAVSDGTSPADALDVALRAGHRRLPVYRGDLGDVMGVVRMRDLIEARDGGLTLAAVSTPPLEVPETKNVADLLVLMQGENNHLAMVVDEYGVTIGLVTIEDVAAALLGSIADEPPSRGLETVGPNRWWAEGTVPIEDLERELGVHLPDGDWNTAAGLVLGLSGRLLRPGEQVSIDGIRIEVLAVDGRRITEMEIQVDPADGPPG